MGRASCATAMLCTVLLALGASSAQDATVDVRNNVFVPQEVEIEVGGVVRWDVSGSNPHSITADGGSFDSHPNCPPVCSTAGSSFEHTFDEAGEVPYYCKIHGSEGGSGMAGTVVVGSAVSDEDARADTTPDRTSPRATRGDTPRTGVPVPLAPGITMVTAAAVVSRALVKRARG